MSKKPINRSPLLLFYVLVGYILLQFAWWAYYIIDLSSYVYIEPDKFQKRVWMILGEALVFFVLLSLGIVKTRKAFRQEFELSNQKTNFLLSVTHELKSPIASIKLYLQTLKKHQLSQEKQDQIIASTLEQSNRLEKLVENILIAARVEDNHYSIQLEQIELSSFLTKLTSTLAIPETHSLSLQVSDTIVQADPMALHSMLINLIENAIKYSPKGGEIKVIAETKEFTIISILDQGKGITKGNESKIFDKFYREQDETIRHTKGTGLGLYIVKKLALLHKGDITYQQNQPKGSIFTIKFPKCDE